MNTDSFAYNQKVRIRSGNLAGETGIVVGRDAYTVEIRLDRIPQELVGFEDVRKGLVNCYPWDLDKI